MQTFSIVGGHNGLMNRSEEIVQIEVKNANDESQSNLDTTVSPRSLVGIKRKVRRQVSHDGIVSSERVE